VEHTSAPPALHCTLTLTGLHPAPATPLSPASTLLGTLPLPATPWNSHTALHCTTAPTLPPHYPPAPLATPSASRLRVHLLTSPCPLATGAHHTTPCLCHLSALSAYGHKFQAVPPLPCTRHLHTLSTPCKRKSTLCTSQGRQPGGPMTASEGRHATPLFPLTYLGRAYPLPKESGGRTGKESGKTLLTATASALPPLSAFSPLFAHLKAAEPSAEAGGSDQEGGRRAPALHTCTHGHLWVGRWAEVEDALCTCLLPPSHYLLTSHLEVCPYRKAKMGARRVGTPS